MSRFYVKQSPLSQPIAINRPALHEDVSDINQYQQSQFVRAGRHTNPLDPQYNLASYQPAPAPEVKQGYDSTLMVEDLPGAQQRSKMFSKALGKVPEERDGMYAVKDINYPPDVILRNKNAGPKVRAGNPSLDVSDINGEKQTRTRSTDPQNPVYKWQHAERADLSNAHKNLLAARDYLKNGDMSLRTDDIVGIEEDRRRRLKRSGYVTETYDNINVADINQKREKIVHTKTTQQVQDLTAAAPQYEPTPHNRKSQQLLSQQMSKSQQLDTDYDAVKELKNSRLLQGILQPVRPPGPLDPPEYVPPPKSEVIERHYRQLPEVKRGVVHETIGELPGPGLDKYQAKLNAGYKHQPCRDITDGKDFCVKEQLTDSGRIFTKPFPSTGLFELDPKQDKAPVSYKKPQSLENSGVGKSQVSAPKVSTAKLEQQKLSESQRYTDIQLIRQLE